MIQRIKDLFTKYKEFIMYIIFGLATTLVNWIITFLCQKVFGLDELGSETMITNGIAWFGAVLFAFITNRKYVFERTSNSLWIELLKFYAARIFTGLIEIFLPDAFAALGARSAKFEFLTQPLFTLKGGIAKLITCVVVIILNYVLSKLVVFTKKKVPEDEA